MFPRRILKVMVVFSVVVALIAGWWIYSVYRFSKPWRRVAREDTETRVLTLLGRPQYVFEWQEEPMKETFEDKDGNFTTAGRAVVKRFHYGSFLFGPYDIEFDSNGRVVAKGHNTLCCSQ